MAGKMKLRKEMIDLRKRLRSKTLRSKEPGACWQWTGSVKRTGYGQIWFRTKPVELHRALFMSFFDVELDSGIVISPCPLSRSCANPEHVGPINRDEIGTRRLKRRKKKRLPPHTLGMEAIIHIYMSKRSLAILAKNYKVRASYIEDIWAGRHHADITAPFRELRFGPDEIYETNKDKVEKLLQEIENR